MSQLLKCKACGEDIAKGVSKCPHCGKDQRNFFGKHKILTGLLVIIVLGIIGAASNSNKNQPTKVGENSKPVASSSSTNASASNTPKTFKTGDIIALGDMSLSVVKVEKSSGSDYDKPKDGNEFVIVHIKIQNKGKNSISYNPLYFKLQNSKGQITSETFTTVNKDTVLNSGDLAAGGEIEGSIPFEEPTGDSGLILQFQDNIFSKDKKISINLQ